MEFNAQSELKFADEGVNKAIKQNAFISKYIMALDHALLWVAALSLAAYFHVSEAYSAHTAQDSANLDNAEIMRHYQVDVASAYHSVCELPQAPPK